MMRFLILSAAGISLSVVGAVGLSMAHTTLVNPMDYRLSVQPVAADVRAEELPVFGNLDLVIPQTVEPVQPDYLGSMQEMAVLQGEEVDLVRPQARPDGLTLQSMSTQNLSIRQSAQVQSPSQRTVQTVTIPAPVAAQGLQNVWVLGVFR